jgi:hypothetical protein
VPCPESQFCSSALIHLFIQPLAFELRYFVIHLLIPPLTFDLRYFVIHLLIQPLTFDLRYFVVTEASPAVGQLALAEGDSVRMRGAGTVVAGKVQVETADGRCA